MIYWLTGQPGAGKTTLARAISKHHVVIDGDELRDILNNRDYSLQGRIRNIEAAQNISRFLNSKGFDVIVAAVSPYRGQREKFKEQLGKDIIEIYVHTTELRGKENFHSKDYEPPLENFIDIDTTNKSIEDSVNEIIKILNK